MRRATWKRITVIGGLIILGLLLAYILKQSWGSVLDKESVVDFIESFRSSSFAIPILFGVFLAAGLAAFPINLILVAATIVMGPWITYSCGLTGSLLSAAIAFGIGKEYGKPLLQKFARHKLAVLTRAIGNRGVLSVALIRIVPIAPFVVVNMVAGFANLRFTTFMAGSLLGMFPGMLAVVLVTLQVQSVITNPSWKTWLLLVVVLLVVGGAVYLVRKKFGGTGEVAAAGKDQG